MALRTRGRPWGHRREAGYTLVALVIGIAILTILIAGVAPSVATIMRARRGKTDLFAAASMRARSRLQRRYGRYPNELKGSTRIGLGRFGISGTIRSAIAIGSRSFRTVPTRIPRAPSCRAPRRRLHFPKSVFGPADQPKTIGPIIGSDRPSTRKAPSGAGRSTTTSGDSSSGRRRPGHHRRGEGLRTRADKQ
jgi:type II secretory pathway pseudopilin PulG